VDKAKTLTGSDDIYNSCETLLDQLDTWMLAQTPLTLNSISSTYHNKTVLHRAGCDEPAGECGAQ